MFLLSHFDYFCTTVRRVCLPIIKSVIISGLGGQSFVEQFHNRENSSKVW